MVLVAFCMWFPVKSLMGVRLQCIETLFNPKNITIQQDRQEKQVREDMFFMF